MSDRPILFSDETSADDVLPPRKGKGAVNSAPIPPTSNDDLSKTNYTMPTDEQAKEKTIIPSCLSEALTLPPRRWIVKGLIQAETINVLCAESKTGKSYVMGHLALSLASGADEWLGMKVHFPEDARVGWLDLDMGHSESLSRLLQIAHGFNNLDYQMIDDRLDIMTASTFIRSEIARPDFFKGDAFDEIVNHIQKRNIQILHVDTLSQIEGNAEENDRGDMQKVMTRFQLLRDLTGCAVIVNHHTNKSTQGGTVFRGSSAIKASANRVMYLSVSKENDNFLLLKAEGGWNAGKQEIGIRRIWTPEIDDNGDILKDADGDTIYLYRQEFADPADYKPKKVTDAHKALYEWIKNHPGANTTAIKNARDEHGVRGNTTITDYLAEMVDNGELITKRGTHSNQYWIADATDQKEQVKEKESPALDFGDDDGEWDDDIAI